MELGARGVRLSAADLGTHLACPYRTALELAVARGTRRAMRRSGSRALERAQRGTKHERAYVASLEARGVRVTRLGEDRSVPDTLAAMRRGCPAIARAPLEGGRWRGVADVLLRRETPSELGGWSYEVVDARLACETRAATLLQLGVHSLLVQGLQGVECERMHVVVPGRNSEPRSFSTADFTAFVRWAMRRLERFVDEAPAISGCPDPVPHCDECSWRLECEARRRSEDHPTLVAGLGRVHRLGLEERGIRTLADLARAPLESVALPSRFGATVYRRLREQARVQFAGREGERPVHELLEPEEGKGLARLPAPSPGDVFLDLEGARYLEDGPLEFLFGWAVQGRDGGRDSFVRWARTRTEERQSFEAFVDFVVGRWREHPELHVYHFGQDERAALVRLAGRHGTRGAEVDALVEEGVLVDLHRVVRQAVRCSVESHALEALEAFTGYTRRFDLEEAGEALRRVQHALEMQDEGGIGFETACAVEARNRDDCLSLVALREWLEGLRSELAEGGVIVPRPRSSGGRGPRITEDPLVGELRGGRAEDPVELTSARALLADLLGWHRREWSAFRAEALARREAPVEELLDDPSALVAPRPDGSAIRGPGNRLLSFRFEPQEVGFDVGDELVDRLGRRIGAVHECHPGAGRIVVRRRNDDLEELPDVFLRESAPSIQGLEDALRVLARKVVEQGLGGDGVPRAARDLLLARPSLGTEPGLRRPGESAFDAGLRWVRAARGGVLAVQGPPGSGKTSLGARWVVEAVRTGHRVGIAAQTHAGVHDLLRAVERAGAEAGVAVRCACDPCASPVEGSGSRGSLESFARGDARVLGGMAGTFAALPFEALDFLFAVEAGRLSLATTLSVAGSARNLVLLGDARQWREPHQATHPDGANVSALEHWLRGEATLAPDRGLFLETTYRLHPQICEPLSALFYEGRMVADPSTDAQRLTDARATPLLPDPEVSGLRFVPISSQGRSVSSPEEARVVRELVETLLEPGTGWIDSQGVRRPLKPTDILVDAPYDAHVGLFARELPRSVPVGTVDRFQGREAPVAIFSAATSSAAEAPRGLGFLLDLHRLNTALSRARCLAILIANPTLLETECRDPDDMRRINAVCHLLEHCSSGTHHRAA